MTTRPLLVLLAPLRSDPESRYSVSLQQHAECVETEPSMAIKNNVGKSTSDILKRTEMAGKATLRQRCKFVVHT